MPRPRTIVTSVDAFVRSLGDLTPEDEAHAALARSLARKMLQAETDENTSSAANVPRIASQLSQVLRYLGRDVLRADPLLAWCNDLADTVPPPPNVTLLEWADEVDPTTGLRKLRPMEATPA